MAALPPAADLFSDPSLSAADKARRYDDFIAKMENLPTRQISGPADLAFARNGGIDFTATQARTPLEFLQKAAQSPEITKNLSADNLASLTAALAQLQVPDLQKDLSLTSPLSTGYVAYDLEAPAKMLTPRPTPLRNRIARRKGLGTSHRYKRITGFTGTGTGGVGVMRPGFVDSTQTRFDNPSSSNALYYNRPAKISYAGDESSVLYVQMGLSDELSWSTQFSGQGFQDMRALSRSSTMYASMLMEERTLLLGRGTLSGYAGILAAPTGVAFAARALVAPEIGITNASANAYVRVVAEMGDLGVSQATAATTAIAFTTGQVIDITYTLPAGATGAKVFVSLAAGADPGDASRFLYTTTAGTVYNGRSGFNKLTIQGTIPTSGTVPTAYPLSQGGTANLTAADGGSAYSAEYDGVLAYATGANAGYTNKLNATFSTTNPGVEYQTAFAAMYLANKAEPDRIVMAAQDRVQLSDAIKGTAASNYQLRIDQSDTGGYTMGALVTQIQNEAVGKMTPIEAHPWLPQGNSLILSDTLPIPDSQVDSVFAVYNVQDLMGVDWPVNQFSYDTSTYWYGALVCYAPAWLGSVVGIQNNR